MYDYIFRYIPELILHHEMTFFEGNFARESIQKPIFVLCFCIKHKSINVPVIRATFPAKFMFFCKFSSSLDREVLAEK